MFFVKIRFPYMNKYRVIYGASPEEVFKRKIEYISAECDRKKLQNMRHSDHRAKEKAARLEVIGMVKPGDIYVYSWGYDQTNIEFFQVIGIQGQMVEFRPIGQKVVSNENCNSMSEMVAPVPDGFSGPSFKKLIKGQNWSGKLEPWFSMDFGCMKIWEGRPQYQSHYA